MAPDLEVQGRIRSRRACDKDQLRDYYDIWAKNYDEDTDVLKCQGPKLVAELVSSHFTGNHSEAKVLDVACGPGEFARWMSEKGFKMFSGTDFSEGMLKEAEKTGLYQHLEQANLQSDSLAGNADTFDVSVIIGALNPNLVPFRVLRDMCKVTKPGGLISLAITIYESDDPEHVPALEKELQLLEDQGLWTKVELVKCVRYMRNMVSDHSEYHKGLVYLFEIK